MNDREHAKTIRQEEINSVAWKACDTFRGVVDPAEYKNYILVFLFLKYLSDVWQDRQEQYIQHYNGDMTRVRRRLARERFVLPEHCTFDYLYQKRNDLHIGQLLNQALDGIEESNKAKLSGVFRNIDFNSETSLGETLDRNKRLKHLIEDFADPRLDLRPSRLGDMDIIGNVYEYLISRFASDAGKKGGEFYTPPEVAILLARLLAPKEMERICDPACGSASLLIKLAREVGSPNYSLFGQESNGSTWALAKMNQFLHFIDNARIEWGNTLSNPKFTENGRLTTFDIVVANPPFSLDKWGAETAVQDPFGRFHRGVPPKSKGDYAFISHMIESMDPQTGRMGVIVPHGVLFRGGAEGRIRKQLIEENLLDAVIGLPPNLFFGTGIHASILIFKRGRSTTDILFIDASREFEKEKRQNHLRPQDLDKILDTYQNLRSIPKYSHRATVGEIRENEYNINIPRYVDTFEEEKEIDIKAVQQEIEEIEAELARVRAKMKQHLKDLDLYE